VHERIFGPTTMMSHTGPSRIPGDRVHDVSGRNRYRNTDTRLTIKQRGSEE
jgi:hypothetical protein